MTVQIYDRWHAAVQEVGELWSSLVGAKGYNPSLHPAWLEATLASWKLIDSTRVAIVRAEPESIAIIPFLVRRRTVCGLPLRCLELASNVFCYHGEIVCDGDLQKTLALFLRDSRLPRWDAFRAENLITNGPTAGAIRTLDDHRLTTGLSMRAGERSPYATIGSDWNAYLGTRAKKVRSNVTRSRRLMREAGETGMEWYEAGSDTQRLLTEMLEIEAHSWKAKAGVDIVPGSSQHAYYERLLPWLAANNNLMANVLYVQNRPVAYTLCADWQGWIGQLKTSFVEELRDAGSRVVHSSIERAFARGAREYDFLGDTAPHKTRWADFARDHEELWTFGRHLRGRIFARIKTLSDLRNRVKEHNGHQPSEAAAAG